MKVILATVAISSLLFTQDVSALACNGEQATVTVRCEDGSTREATHCEKRKWNEFLGSPDARERAAGKAACVAMSQCPEAIAIGFDVRRCKEGVDDSGIPTYTPTNPVFTDPIEEVTDRVIEGLPIKLF
jgi:hypothetical protein